MIDAHKAGEGYKKIAKHFQVPISSVWNVIKKWQLTGTVEAKIRGLFEINYTRLCGAVVA